MQLLDGKALATQIKTEIAAEVARMVANGAPKPHLAAILVGNDSASETYVAHKVKACQEVGFDSTLIRLSEQTTEAELLDYIAQLNNDPQIDGFIVQLPLPPAINPDNVTLAIDYRKDVDGFHPVNVGRMVQGLPCFLPATPFGIVELLRRNQIETAGKHCVVVGRSNIVGKPVSMMLAQNSPTANCTVTLCHSRTRNLAAYTRQADILIAALGKPEFVTADMVKQGAVIIDVGTTRVPDPSKKSGYRLAGDVKFDEVAPLCSYITPVPGGVGPMTVISLITNTLRAAQRKE
ncbi:MAG: bifunctional 5,10-methylene-tetrahydrofolate dehydrogenase/5,10-methylene-tetrahydrofolate cyclohydrolase [Chitinophagales bacterium]|nr:bifunctional 5,10-methylene-tetrahydrofolate dehydrogenase/5,10-methylene-tetrahydrofolate cyclohydrolase [Chitinophagales bacterium]